MPAPAQLRTPRHTESLSPAIAFSLSYHHGICPCSWFLKGPQSGAMCLDAARAPAAQHTPHLALPPPDMGTERNQPPETFPPLPGPLGFLQ